MQFPYAQFPCTALPGDMTFDPFWEAVCRLERCDFKVLGATADGLSANCRLFKLHGTGGVASQLVYKVPNPYSLARGAEYLFPIRSSTLDEDCPEWLGQPEEEAVGKY